MYDPELTKAASKLYEQIGPGKRNSLAVASRGRCYADGVPLYRWDQDGGASWEFLAWECCGLRTQRPAKPSHPWAQRAARPQGGKTKGEEVLKHLFQVQQAIWKRSREERGMRRGRRAVGGRSAVSEA